MHRASFVAALLSLAACGGGGPTARHVPVAVITEAFVTPPEPMSMMDSPAVWINATGERAHVIATGKWTHRLHVYSAADGAPIGTAGERGTGPVEFHRPNGIAIAGDIALVVERDNARVQALRLPHFEYLATFGEGVLRRPYGIALLERDSTEFDIFVTDDYRGFLGRTPGDHDLGERVKRFRITASEGGVGAAYLGSFGDTTGAGRLRKVESLAIDADAGVLLIADEEARDVKVYEAHGVFTGQVLWHDVLRHEPEGIALYACGAEAGYWIVADQHRTRNRFLVFDRKSFRLLGAFSGRTVQNTDGVALVQRPVGSMTAGVLYAVHDDRAVGAFSWSDVAAALDLRTDCVSRR